LSGFIGDGTSDDGRRSPMAALLAVSDRILPPARREALHEVGLLLLRAGFGLGLMLGHGWAKLSHFSESAATFPDPIGLGSQLGFTLVVFAEFFCAGAVAMGLLTRLATVPVLINMGVALLVVHAADPWKVKELAFVYLLGFLCVTLLGPGRLSLDELLRRVLSRGREAKAE
jgi:putative oxidoreductase